jgi:hypothetical protein
VAAGVAAAFIAAACASRGASPPDQGPVIEGLVLRVETRGGFLPAAHALARIPQFSLYADGLIVMEGAQIAIYPGPAITAVFSSKVDAEGMGRIIEAARRAGLDGPDRTYELPTVADAGTTTFTFVEAGGRHVVSAYALGLDPSEPSIPDDERKARAALLELQGKLQTLQSWLPEGSLSAERQFDYQGLAVIVTTEAVQDELVQLEQRELTWPLNRSIEDLAKLPGGEPLDSCFTVQGEDLAKLRPLVEMANELTPWRDDGKVYRLRFRPLLPDESRCPDLEHATR